MSHHGQIHHHYPSRITQLASIFLALFGFLFEAAATTNSISPGEIIPGSITAPGQINYYSFIGTSNVLHYIVRFADLGHRERAWAAFGADPEWLRVRAESEKDGPIVARIRNEIWRPSAYSPMQ